MKAKTFEKYLYAQGMSHSSVKSHWRQSLDFINWSEAETTGVEHCTYQDILRYVQQLKKRGILQRTVQLYLCSVRHYFNWLIAVERRADNPLLNFKVQGIKRQKLYTILSKTELENLYQNYGVESVTQARNKMMLGLLVYQGVNVTELQNLEVGDLKLREGKVFINSTRRSNERLLDLVPHQILDLMEYTLQTRQTILKESGKSSEKLFISSGDSEQLHGALAKFMRQLKRQHKQLHSLKQLRASVLTHWLKVYNLREVQYRAGHRFVSSTEQYLVHDLESLSEDINQYHPF